MSAVNSMKSAPIGKGGSEDASFQETRFQGVRLEEAYVQNGHVQGGYPQAKPNKVTYPDYPDFSNKIDHPSPALNPEAQAAIKDVNATDLRYQPQKRPSLFSFFGLTGMPDPFNLEYAYERLRVLLTLDGTKGARQDVPVRGFYLNILM